jgi:hypothetical protein
MLDTDGLFRLAATNFQQAETHLTDCEIQLLKLRAKLDRCAAMVRRAPRDEQLWRQVDVILNGEQAGAAAGSAFSR